MRVKQIIFDFDGVILDSHIIKTKAFYELFRKFGLTTAKKSRLHHLKNTGVSRNIKFSYIYKNILKKKLTKKKLFTLSKNFSNFCRKKILKLKISNVLLLFLKNNSNKIDFFISTGTPQKEIELILKKKKLYKFFKKIHGSPKKKIQHIRKIRKNKKKTVFIGDSIEDYNACKKTNTQFILKLHSENQMTFKDFKILKIRNFNNFEKLINKK